MSEIVKLYCENGCGHKLIAQEIQHEKIESVMAEAECLRCDEVTLHKEDVTVKTLFRCSGCNEERYAYITPTEGPAVTEHRCSNCNEKTEWMEEDWSEVEIQ